MDGLLMTRSQSEHKNNLSLMSKVPERSDGVLNICKPRGISSFRALSIVKRKLGLKKVGHLGTLDPAACGVLVLMCGRATKLADKLHSPTKVYRTLIVFGKETETLDDEGEVIATSEIIPTKEQVEKVLPQMTGEIEIEVPKFSAVHINGKRAYDLARKGIEFEAPKRVVAIKRFEMLTIDECKNDLESIGEQYDAQENSFYLEIECQTGTYIRSLAKLLAQKLGTVAIASLIIRTKVGDFDIKDARMLDDVTICDLVIPSGL
ncbi:MAG: tRNA pseudouridine(55) synthase TruB [Firmicutes bacterium]|nr:tRNA pseudouridine(55) synthase TruB [Bacillota bacterium]